jgi:hypothetical protein
MTKAETWGADVSVPIHKQLHFCLDGVRLTEVIVKAASFELLATVPIRAAAIRAATIYKNKYDDLVTRHDTV